MSGRQLHFHTTFPVNKTSQFNIGPISTISHPKFNSKYYSFYHHITIISSIMIKPNRKINRNHKEDKSPLGGDYKAIQNPLLINNLCHLTSQLWHVFLNITTSHTSQQANNVLMLALGGICKYNNMRMAGVTGLILIRPLEAYFFYNYICWSEAML